MAIITYINIILSTNDDKFPTDFGVVSEIKKEIGLVLQKYPQFKMRRYNFDIVDDEFNTEEGIRSNIDAE